MGRGKSRRAEIRPAILSERTPSAAKHHAGALTMVHELFSSPGAGQDSEIFAFASDVDADQRMEIDRMSALLKELQK